MAVKQLYRIRNIKTNEWWENKASNSQDACAKAGWEFADCEIKYKSDYGYGGWKKCREK